MKQFEKVREQFNRQAEAFGSWAVTKNVEYMKGIAEFISFSPNDSLLDVACGTGDFSLFTAPMIKKTVGVDVSEKMVEIALRNKAGAGIANAEFKVAEVSRLPAPAGSFDVVFCKSSFHHLDDTAAVFGEMVRCCKNGGKVGVCDILAFDDPTVDGFFEAFEKEVDPSHFKTLSRQDFSRLFEKNRINMDKVFDLDIEHSLAEYCSHAVRTGENERNIDSLVARAKADRGISAFWTFGKSREDTRFRKKVILLLGRK